MMAHSCRTSRLYKKRRPRIPTPCRPRPPQAKATIVRHGAARTALIPSIPNRLSQRILPLQKRRTSHLRADGPDAQHATRMPRRPPLRVQRRAAVLPDEDQERASAAIQQRTIAMMLRTSYWRLCLQSAFLFPPSILRVLFFSIVVFGGLELPS